MQQRKKPEQKRIAQPRVALLGDRGRAHRAASLRIGSNRMPVAPPCFSPTAAEPVKCVRVSQSCRGGLLCSARITFYCQ